MKVRLLFILLFIFELAYGQVYERFEYRPFNIPISDYICSYDIADFNGDGKFDLVRTSQTPDGLQIEIKLNEEDSLQYSLGKIDSINDFQMILSFIKNPVFIAVADIDGDGDLDIYLCEVGGFQINSFVNVLENKSTGDALSFSPKNISTLENEYVMSIPSVFDFDKDGLKDVIISNFDGRNTFYKNIGNFEFLKTGENLLGFDSYTSPISITELPAEEGKNANFFVFNFETDFHILSGEKVNDKYLRTTDRFMVNPDTLKAKFFQMKVGDFNYDGYSDIFFSSLTFDIDKKYITQTWLLVGTDKCNATIEKNGINIGTGTYNAGINISSSGTISSPDIVTFNAGQYIVLSPGFSVGDGALFKAIIKDCPD